jgi:hypothetical protein
MNCNEWQKKEGMLDPSGAYRHEKYIKWEKVNEEDWK